MCLFFFLIEVKLISNVVLVSGRQQSDSLFQIPATHHYEILSIVPCAVQKVIIVHLFSV